MKSPHFTELGRTSPRTGRSADLLTIPFPRFPFEKTNLAAWDFLFGFRFPVACGFGAAKAGPS